MNVEQEIEALKRRVEALEAPARVFATTTMSTNSTTTVPKTVKLLFGLEEGDKIEWCVKGKELIVKRRGDKEVKKVEG